MFFAVFYRSIVIKKTDIIRVHGTKAEIKTTAGMICVTVGKDNMNGQIRQLPAIGTEVSRPGKGINQKGIPVSLQKIGVFSCRTPDQDSPVRHRPV
jgi:hypothetical protein